jgi:hypothetical protein
VTTGRRAPGPPERRFRGAVAVVALVGAVLLAGCGSDGGSTGSAAPGSTPPSTPASTRAPGQTVAIGEAANGTTVTLPKAGRLAVTLHNTYWQLADPADPKVLVVASAPAARPDPTCRSIPGTGCGTVTAVYAAGTAGTTTLAAHRDTCGEALRCTPAQSDWSVTVHVSG